MSIVAWLPLAVTVLVLQGILGLRSLRSLRQQGETDTSLLGHIDELRKRILIALMAWLGWSLALFMTRLERILGFWVPVPAVQETLAAQAFDTLQSHLVPANVILTVTRPLDGFLAQFTLALTGGFLLAFPVILSQTVGYFGPALQEHERHALKRMTLPSSLAFLLGAAFGYLFILPFMLDALYGYAFALGASPLLTVSDLVTFTINTVVVFGLAFQTPIAMVALSSIGLVSPRTWAGWWRHAIVASVVIGAITTDPSLVSQLLVAGPLLVLYGVGLLGAWLTYRKQGEASLS